MKLYYHPLSTFSQKTLIALYEKGATFEREIVDLTSEEKRAEYRKFYPLGKIPVLVDRDKFIPESSIIIEYLETAIAGGTRLIPEDRETARRVRFHDRTNDLYLDDPAVSILFERDVAKAKETLDVTYRFLDKQLEKRTWLVGETFTMADCAEAPPLGYLRRIHPFDAFKNVAAYWNRLAERPSVRRVLDEAKPYLHNVMK